MNTHKPFEHDIVFVGGGHSHALVLRRWAMNPLPGVRLTLISKEVLTPYSGMLPGYIAGHYTVEDIHIDLLKLCSWAGVRFIRGEMTGIDTDKKTLQISGRADIAYDVLSLDTGSTPTLDVPGAREFTTPVKPVHSFIERWKNLQHRQPSDLGVVGAGAGGYELVMAMAYRLKSDAAVNVHWFLRGSKPMSDRPEKVGLLALEKAAAAGVNVLTGFDVSRVTSGAVHAVDGRVQNFDELLWCTAAASPAWPAAAGLATDSQGFIATTKTLQSASHPNIFATGDIGTQRDTPSAKAGVFAVRQAPVLFHNLRALVAGNALKDYVPQKDFLSLVSTGDRYAIGSRSGFSVAGGWVWRLKHSIDRAFMDKFQHLPTLDMRPARSSVKNNGSEPLMRCNGCGAKVPAFILRDVLDAQRIEIPDGIDIESGVEHSDDAAVVSWSAPQLVQSVDQLRAIIDDPYTFGRIAALHALSDIHAQAARAHSAQVLITLPYANAELIRRELDQLMQGILVALNAESCVLLGGHTSEGAELQVGLVVNGQRFEKHATGKPETEIQKSRQPEIDTDNTRSLNPNTHPAASAPTPAQANTEPTNTEQTNTEQTRTEQTRTEQTRTEQTSTEQTRTEQTRTDQTQPGKTTDFEVILTKPLGVGIVFAGLMQNRADGVDVDAALQHMLQSNASAGDILANHGVVACTDVTGFGLVGHLQRLALQQGFTVELRVDAVPVLSGVHKLIRLGVQSSLSAANQTTLNAIPALAALPQAERVIFSDPQTSGGLAALVPTSRAQACVQALRSTGYLRACVVGHATRVRDESATAGIASLG